MAKKFFDVFLFHRDYQLITKTQSNSKMKVKNGFLGG